MKLHSRALALVALVSLAPASQAMTLDMGTWRATLHAVAADALRGSQHDVRLEVQGLLDTLSASHADTPVGAMSWAQVRDRAIGDDHLVEVTPVMSHGLHEVVGDLAGLFKGISLKRESCAASDDKAANSECKGKATQGISIVHTGAFVSLYADSALAAAGPAVRHVDVGGFGAKDMGLQGPMNVSFDMHALTARPAMLHFGTASIPEPQSVAMWLLGLGALAAVARRRAAGSR
jgi:MYXO-CTERM domain-containing protein